MPAGLALEERLFDPNESLHAPHLLDVEVAQVLRRYARAGEVETQRCLAALDDLAGLPLIRYPHDVLMPRVWDLRANLSAYDAVYIARVAPTTMIFVPCLGGISHNEAESTTFEQCAAGAQVLLDAVLEYDRGLA